VYDSHELYSEQEFSGWERARWTEIEAKYIPHCDVVITVNQSIARELGRRYGVSRVRVIANAERVWSAPPARIFHGLYQLPEEKKVLLLQGGLSAGRNLEVLLEAMRYVRNPDVVLVFLGDGALLEKLKARAAR